MTAEVAVLNSVGVALAADSAVSIGRDAEKIYTSADKLFQLHASAPVGVMIYGSAVVCGIPWETVIKEYRRKTSDTRLDTISDYAKSFKAFLTDNRRIFRAEQERNNVYALAVGALSFLFEQLKRRLEQEIEQKGAINESDIRRVGHNFFAESLRNLKRNEYLPGFKAGDVKQAFIEYLTEFQKAREFVFENLPLEKASERLLAQILSNYLCRKCFGMGRTGIVIAGFGENEFVPSLLSFEMEELAMGRPRAIETNNISVVDGGSSAILPFAQQDMVHSFLEGVDRELMDRIRGSTSSLFEGVVDSILNVVRNSDPALGSKLDAAIRPAIKSSLTQLFGDWEKQKERFWQPVLHIVAALPKDELPAMAEALVNLTKFRRRVTRVRETVGGPIDVAVITKGDGFVWTKRKHYFSPDLNPRVMTRMQKGE